MSYSSSTTARLVLAAFIMGMPGCRESTPAKPANDVPASTAGAVSGEAPAAPAPAPAEPATDESQNDVYRWTTVSADGTAVISHGSDGQGKCRRTCTDAPGAEVWSAEGCIAKRHDLRFVANDCGKVVVLYQLPEVKVSERERWRQAPVIRVYAREKLDREVTAAGAVRDWKAVRSAGTTFYWLGGALGQPGLAPRYSSDGNAVELQSIDGQAYKMTLTSTP